MCFNVGREEVFLKGKVMRVNMRTFLEDWGKVRIRCMENKENKVKKGGRVWVEETLRF